MGEKRVVVIKGTRIPSSSTGTLRGCAWEYRRSIRRQRVLMLSLRLESPPLLYPFHPPLSLFLALLFVQPPGCTTLSFSRALLRLSSITLVPSLHSCQLDFLHSSLSPSLPLCRSLAPLVRLNSSFRLFYTRIDVWIVFRRKTKRIQPPNELSSICIPLHPSPRVSHDVA